MTGASDASAPGGAASGNPASRKLPEPIEDAIAALVETAKPTNGFSFGRSCMVDMTVDLLRDAIRPSLLPAEMTPAVALVLSLLSFETGPTAHIFRAAGAEIPTRIEDEQAYVLFRFLHLALQLGLDWGAEADRLVAEARAAVKAKKAGEEVVP